MFFFLACQDSSVVWCGVPGLGAGKSRQPCAAVGRVRRGRFILREQWRCSVHCPTHQLSAPWQTNLAQKSPLSKMLEGG